MATASEKQQYSFQAETRRVLDLLAHSLYQSKEIALRELISNASDSLDKMRHVSLTDERFKDVGELEIRLEVDDVGHTLTLADNGVGMTREELVENLGTIARSGSLEFLGKLGEEARKDVSLIGQFGVGFYSAFMIADRIEFRTRSFLADENEGGWLWESTGDGTFSVAPAPGAPRGANIRLHLKEDVRDLATKDRVKGVIKRYSGYIPHPIYLSGEKVNDVRPIWAEPKSQVTEEQHRGFFQHLSHFATDDPLWHLHFSVDSPIQFHALLYCPSRNFESMGIGRYEHGLNLCAKRVLVQNDCRDLLPEHFRFLTGLVDSEDLPLNVSRETLQDNTVFRKISGVLVRKTLDRLLEIAEREPDKYLEFHREFSPFLKEGVARDFEHRQKLSRLLRFHSSKVEDDQLTSLEAYVERSPESQKEIYYVGGPDLKAARKNPNLEIFEKKGIEVLYLDDPVDEFVMSSLREFDGRTLKPIDDADLELPETEDSKIDEPTEPVGGGFARVLEAFREALGDKVAEVRESKRLVDQPVCLVNPGGLSTQMQKLLEIQDKSFQHAPRILEVNPRAPLIERLAVLSANEQNAEFLRDCGRQLYVNALLLEGFNPDPEETVGRVQKIMEQAAQGRSSIIH